MHFPTSNSFFCSQHFRHFFLHSMGNSRCMPSVVFFFLFFLCSQSLPIVALDRGEKAALTDMQAEWGTQLGWTGSPKCSWLGVECIFGHVHGLYELSFTFFSNLKTLGAH